MWKRNEERIPPSDTKKWMRYCKAKKGRLEITQIGLGGNTVLYFMDGVQSG